MLTTLQRRIQQEEVTTACKCQNEALCHVDEQMKLSFCEDTCQESVDIVAGYVETIKAVEERIAEYEINKEDSYQDSLGHSIQRIGNDTLCNSNKEKWP